MSITVSVVTTPEALAQAFAIRSQVYIGEQKCPYEEEFDGNDFCATHFVAYIDGEPAGTLRVRHLDHAILPGCTRGALLALLAESGIACEERAFSLEELRAAREIFVTAATTFVKPILRLDGAPVGDGKVGPVARRLFDIFARHVQGGLRNDRAA